MRNLILGNWKMNKSSEETRAFFSEFKDLFSNSKVSFTKSNFKIGLAPSFTSLESAKNEINRNLKNQVLLGSQNIHWLESGAHTGEISPQMLKGLDVNFTIIGHSERRQFYGETNETVSLRTKAALENNFLPVVCIGETEEEYKAGKTADIVSTQIEKSLAGITSSDISSGGSLAIAYEPIWAIGTGLAASPQDAQKTHAIIREKLSTIFSSEIANNTPILYGGSVKAGNIEELSSQKDINGALVGGASLNPKDFFDLINNAKFPDS